MSCNDLLCSLLFLASIEADTKAQEKTLSRIYQFSFYGNTSLESKESARLIVHICCRNQHEENFGTFGLKMGQTPIL